MNFTDYYNKEILIELSKDKEKLKRIAEEDNGFIFKRMEENHILPEKEIVQYVGTSPSVIFLLNNYRLTQEEKISLSKNFKSDSILMKEINQKDVMDDSSILSYLTRTSANFSFPGKFLSFETIKDNVEKIIKYDSEDSEKKEYIVESLNNLSVEKLKELPYSIFRKFYEIYDLKKGAFFDDIEHCKIFKSQNLINYPSSSALTVKEYLKKTGDIQGILLADSFSTNDIQDFYTILKESEPSLTMTDLFYNGSRKFREAVITNDLSDDLNIHSVVESYLNEEEFFENDFRFGFNDLNYLPPTLQNHWKFLDVTQWNSKKGKLDNIIEATKNSPRSMIQSNHIGFKITELIENVKEKNGNDIKVFCDNSGDFIENVDVEKLKEATKVVFERIFTQKQYRDIYINDNAVDVVIQLTENSPGKYAYFALRNLNKKTPEEKVDLSKITPGVPPEFIEEFNKMLADPNYYSKNCPIAKMDWYGNWDNIYRNHNGEILISSESIYFFSQINQNNFLEKAFKNKEAVLSDTVIKNIRNEIQNQEKSLSKEITRFIKIAIKDNHTDPKIKSLINEIKNSKMRNAFFPKKDDSVDNKNLLMSSALNAFLEIKEFITQNNTFFYNVRNNDDRYWAYEDSRNPTYNRMCELEDKVTEIKEILLQVEPSVKNMIFQLLPCKEFDDAYILDMMFQKPELKNDLIIQQLNDVGMSKQEVPNDFIDNLKESELKKVWSKLNDTSKTIFFEAYIDKLSASLSFYNVFSLFSFEKPKSDLDKKLKSIIIEKAPEKILYCHYEQKTAFNMNFHDLYDICKSITKNEKWGFKRNINTRFADFVSDVFKRSKVKDYENILELARKEDSAAYSMLVAPSIFYNGSYNFKDNENIREVPFSDFKSFSNNYYQEHPELIEYDYSGNRKDVSDLLYLYSKMDLDVVADGITKIRKSLIKPIIQDYEKSGWTNNSFGKNSITEIFPVICYADYEINGKIASVDKLKDFQKKIGIELVDKLINKDIANVNIILANSYLTDVYTVEKLTTEVLSKVVSPDSFRKAFLGVVSTGYDKDNKFYVQTLDDNNVNYTFENRKHYYNQGLNRFIEMNTKNISFLNYTLSIEEKIENNFVRMPFLGTIKTIKDTLNDSDFNGSVYENFNSFKHYINDSENKIILKGELDTVFSKYDIPDDEEDLGFSIKL